MQSDLSGGDLQAIIGKMRWVLLLIALPRVFFLVQCRRNHFMLLSVATILVSILAVYQSFVGDDLLRDSLHSSLPGSSLYRAQGFFNISMTFAYSFGILLCFYFSRFLQEGVCNKWNLVTGLCNAIALYLTFTRGAWLAVFCALLFMVILQAKKYLPVFLSGFTILFSALYGLSSSFRMRLATLFESGFESNRYRTQLWQANWEIFKDNPWFGVGYRMNDRLQEAYYQQLGITDYITGHAHNTYLQFLAGLGVGGLLLLLALKWSWWVKAYRSFQKYKSWQALAFLGAVLVLSIGGLTECNFQDTEVKHMFLFLYAVFISDHWRRQNVA